MAAAGSSLTLNQLKHSASFVTEGVLDQGTISWKLKQFSRLQEIFSDESKDFINSPTVLIHGKQWFLRVFPSGNHGTGDKKDLSFVAIYLACKGVSKDEVYVTFSITLKAKPNLHDLVRNASTLLTEDECDWGFASFVHKLNLSQYLKNDTLRITCDFNVFGRVSTKQALNPLVVQGCNLRNNLLELFVSAPKDNSGDVVTFIIGDKRIPAHKFILCARSSVFCALLNSGMRECKENVVEIYDAEPAAFTQFLRYLYSGQISGDFLNENLEQLLFLSNKYDVPSLRAMCDNALAIRLEPSNALSTLALARLYHSTHLKSYVLNFVSDHLLAVLASPDFKRVSEEDPDLVVEISGAFATKLTQNQIVSTAVPQV